MATTSQRSFHPISITTQDKTGLWIPSPNLPLFHEINDFRLKNLLICKNEKKNIMREVVARRCSTKKLSEKLHKTHRKIPVLVPLSNTVKGLQAIRLATLLKRNPRTGVLEPTVPMCSLKRCSSKIHKIHRKAPGLEFLFK